jgi:hypothetical protein
VEHIAERLGEFYEMLRVAPTAGDAHPMTAVPESRR